MTGMEWAGKQVYSFIKTKESECSCGNVAPTEKVNTYRLRVSVEYTGLVTFSLQFPLGRRGCRTYSCHSAQASSWVATSGKEVTKPIYLTDIRTLYI